ncbi:MAG: enoyl-CoA hydratase [Rhizobiales bacterium]|nr:enoyl-CoA hydratase [Hyphomicrobiales bacterium]MBA67359.1 enoyl-CoA hydratase [Hyphomicrobiales bacterium]|tara:strand:+ start:632 stop:1396 length:765 start_codon:yes stop_codon:yes gene_type:complete
MAITTDIHEGVATITIDRPEKLNALSLAMYDALGAAFAEANRNDAVNAVVLTGAGDRAFCVGADLLESIPALARDDFDISAWDPAHLKGVEFYKPIVAAVRGMCIGGGFELILGTDIRIASEDAAFQLPEVGHGFVPAGGTLVRLVRQIAYAHAMEIMLSGRRFTAGEMQVRGVVNEIVKPGDTLARAQEIAGVLAGYSPIAVQAIKRAALTFNDIPLDEAFAREAKLGQTTFTSDRARQGLDAFSRRASKQGT